MESHRYALNSTPTLNIFISHRDWYSIIAKIVARFFAGEKLKGMEQEFVATWAMSEGHAKYNIPTTMT
jgi:hypothetical protein